MKYVFIKEKRLEYPVPTMCRLLEVSASGYYKWLNKPESERKKQEIRFQTEIKAAHRRNRETYGPERLQKDLESNGVIIGVHRIKRIRRELGIRCIQKKKFKATTNSKHDLPIADNLLEQNFEVKAPNKAWVTDITYIPTGEGWLYLAAHKDLLNGEIAGYSLSSRMTRSLVMDSLIKAVKAKRPPAGLINHSDRGSQYCSGDYQKMLKKYEMKASMSRKGNCYDNAPMESFWGTIKQELINHRRYETRNQAIKEISEYIDIFYNRQRTQAQLGYLSPVAFSINYYKKKMTG